MTDAEVYISYTIWGWPD